MSGPHCFENPPTISPSYGEGCVQEIAGFKVYITGPQHSNLAIILASDAFGYEGVTFRKIADKVAAAGFLVVVPDFFLGDPVDLNYTPESVAAWLRRHSPARGCENARKIIAELRSRGVSSIGAAGFCWGGMLVVKLAKFDDIQAAVLLHPGQITDDEIHAVKVPIAILGAEIDKYCAPEQVKHLGEILSAKPEIESFVKVYPGVGHGWAIRYNENDEMAVKNAEEAHTEMLNWLTKYVN